MVQHANHAIATVCGQPSYLMKSSHIELAITRLGAMLGPVTFSNGSHRVQPYSIAPWAEETPGPMSDAFLHALRGDFLCSAFGDNDGAKIPPHGDSVHAEWSAIGSSNSDRVTSLRLSCNLPQQGGRCEVTTT